MKRGEGGLMMEAGRRDSVGQMEGRTDGRREVGRQRGGGGEEKRVGWGGRKEGVTEMERERGEK